MESQVEFGRDFSSSIKRGVKYCHRSRLFSLCSHGRRNPRSAFAAGWRITARCAWGKREGMKTRRECHYTRELDLETLVWTRGPNFPLSSLDGRAGLVFPLRLSSRVAGWFLYLLRDLKHLRASRRRM